MTTSRYQCVECLKTYIGPTLPSPMMCNCHPPRAIDADPAPGQTSTLSASAAVFEPSSTPVAAIAMGVAYDGTDPGALNQEFFFVEAPTATYRTVLPHGHITCNMDGSVANISYTSRTGQKLSYVGTNTDWNTILADSAAVYDAMCATLHSWNNSWSNS
jgi:hypothetical protein